MLKRITQSFATAGALSISLASTAFAQFGGETPNIGGLPSEVNESGIRQLVINLLTSVLNFLALIAVVVVVIAGIRLIVSQGEDDAKDKAKKTILYALIGLAVVLFARVIVGLVTVYLADTVN